MAELHGTRRYSHLMGRGANRAMIRIFLAAALTWCAGATAATGTDLYRTKVTVTGQGEANRIVGFAACLEDVLIKVSGAQKLAGDRRLAAYKSKAKSFVTAFSYRDQFFGKPIRDEQGTRDRPYDLTVDFEESKINGVLNALGLKPWLSHRPVLAVFVAMEQGPRNYVVTLDGAQSDLQRDALLAAADKRGMLIVLPGAAALAKSNVTGETLGTTPLSALAPVAAEQDAEAVLTGRLVWDDRQFGWATQWQIDWAGRTHRWQRRGVTFDEAFRRGIGGAAAARNRYQAARARRDMRTWQVERRKRTRHLIELGGLVVKAGLVNLTGDDRAMIYGALLWMANKLQSDKHEQARQLWAAKGNEAFEGDPTTHKRTH